MSQTSNHSGYIIYCVIFLFFLFLSKRNNKSYYTDDTARRDAETQYRLTLED